MLCVVTGLYVTPKIQLRTATAFQLHASTAFQLRASSSSWRNPKETEALSAKHASLCFAVLPPSIVFVPPEDGRNYARKINRRKLDKLNIIKICEEILNPSIPMALKLSGILMGALSL